MSESEQRDRDFQLTGDDPMMEQIEAATSTPALSGDQAGDGSWSLPSYSVPPVSGEGGSSGGSGREEQDQEQAQAGPLEPGEPAWMQHEPDASQ